MELLQKLFFVKFPQTLRRETLF